MAMILFQDKQNCCGCGACMNACGRDAIIMTEDEHGFVFPQIDPDLCIECGACVNACGFQKPPLKAKPSECYAATAKHRDLLRKSSSGGVFAVLATDVLARGGAVYGVAMPRKNDRFYPGHMRIERLEDITFLQGSKYVQSDTGYTYRQAEADLKSSREVLFSGTPCQIAGLKKYLGKNYDNLLTVEVICHGVPSARLFSDFITMLEKTHQKRIDAFVFRTKGKKTGKNVCIRHVEQNGQLTERIYPSYQLSYMYFFGNASILRVSCYNCPFADCDRVADLTIGDFWGFHQEHPEVSADRKIGDEKGVSCILINSEKGEQAIAACRGEFELIQTQLQKIARHNEQLNHPCFCGAERNELLKIYCEGGYPALENHFSQAYWKERFIQSAISAIPQGARVAIKRIIGRLKQKISR